LWLRGCRLVEFATHLDVHYATVSRCLKQAEQENVWLQESTLIFCMERLLFGEREAL